MTNIYLELNDYNDTTVDTVAQLDFNSDNILDDQNEVWAVKFNLTTKNFPLYVPNIINAFTPYYPQGAITANTQIKTIENTSFFMTDWAISVRYISTAETIYFTTPIYWEKPTDTARQLPLNLIDNDFFWCKDSVFLCDIITNALNRTSQTPLSFYFVKNGEKWSILAQKNIFTSAGGTFDIIEIYFNDAMRKYFNFYYNTIGAISFPSIQTTTINSNDFYAITTTTTNNLLFPFKKIIFISNNMPVQPQFMSMTRSSIINNYQNAILSYDLNISDISLIGNNISFTSQSKDRSLSLTNSYLNKFSIYCFMVTRDNNFFQIKLQQGDSLDMLLMFF